MLRKLFNLLWPSVYPGIPQSWSEIPRWPPFLRGLPAAPVEALLEGQKDIVRQIQISAGMTPQEFDEYVYPAIVDYARFVHLLPASNDSHHRGGGGLLRYGLEVGFWALQSSQGSVFGVEYPVDQRKPIEPRWRYAVFMAGLYAGVGIAAYNITVKNSSGDLVWKPFESGLLEWCTKHGLKEYYLQWKSRKESEAKRIAPLIAANLMPKAGLAYITGVNHSEDILASFYGSVSGLNCEICLLSKLVNQASQNSIGRDIALNANAPYDGGAGVPLHRHIIDAMRTLLRSQWEVNKIGSRIWVTEEGVHISWEQAVPEILATLDEQEVPGLPRDPDSIAEIMFDYDLAQRFVDQKGTSHLYWTMEIDAPRVGSAQFRVLRLKDGEKLFPNSAPIPVKARFVDRSAQERAASEPMSKTPLQSEGLTGEHNKEKGGDNNRNTEKKDNCCEKPQRATSQRGKTEEARIEKKSRSAGVSATGLKPPSKRKKNTSGANSDRKTEQEEVSERSTNVETSDEIFTCIQEELVKGGIRNGVDVFQVQDRIGWRFPIAITKSGLKARDTIEILGKERKLDKNPKNPMQKIWEIKANDDTTTNYVRLSKSDSLKFINDLAGRLQVLPFGGSDVSEARK